MPGPTTTPRNTPFPPQTQAAGLRSLAMIGRGVAAAARIAAAVHMAESAAAAQSPRDQAARLRELIASMSTGGAG
ncbi:MAG: hypothetical protein K2Q09_06250 [Phycisphaerales bacterium]|nr:hypothetical protein [Phycisphaerales bacterium]